MNKTFNDPNLKYSDQLTPLAQMAGFEGGSSDLPTPTAADAGKVLTVDETGAYELGDVDALPAISAGDAGKVLTVNAGATAAEWAAPSGGGAVLLYTDSETLTVESDYPELPADAELQWVPYPDCLKPYKDLACTVPYTLSEFQQLLANNALFMYIIDVNNEYSLNTVIEKTSDITYNPQNPAMQQSIYLIAKDIVLHEGNYAVGYGAMITTTGPVG